MAIRDTIVLSLFAFGLSTIAHSGNASVIAYIYENGSDVVVSASGSLDISGLNTNGTATASAGMFPNGGGLAIGSPVVDLNDQLTGFTSSPGSFGTGGPTTADFGTGDKFAFDPGRILLPLGYSTGQSIVSTSTYLSASLASLGLFTGIYDYEWSTDKVSLRVGVSPVPLPSALPIFLACIGALGLVRRGRRKST